MDDAAPDSDVFDRVFVFDSCGADESGLIFEYHWLEQGVTSPTIHVRLSCASPTACPAASLAVHVGMSLVPYLWMERPSRQILIRAGLPQSALGFWSKVYQGVLAEFFLTNRLTPFEPELLLESEADAAASGEALGDCVLVPLGAGKDSIVCFALLRECLPVSKLRWFYVGRSHGEFAACDRYRKIALQESEAPLVQEGIAVVSDEWKLGYNAVGHPFACFVLFSAVLQASAWGYGYVCLGNERSANYDDVPGVNHQWDKSAQFMSLVREYLKHFTQVQVFSAIQQWWELQIVALFCRMPLAAPYWTLFLSCNQPVEEQHWCGNCEKCLFIALCLQSFEEPSRVHEIWRGENVLSNADLLPKLREMLGQREKAPPFDCVGTEEEASMAAALSVRKYRKPSHGRQHQVPYLLKKCGAVSWKSPSLDLLTQRADADVPDWFRPVIARADGLLAEVAGTM